MLSRRGFSVLIAVVLACSALDPILVRVPHVPLHFAGDADRPVGHDGELDFSDRAGLAVGVNGAKAYLEAALSGSVAEAAQSPTTMADEWSAATNVPSSVALGSNSSIEVASLES